MRLRMLDLFAFKIYVPSLHTGCKLMRSYISPGYGLEWLLGRFWKIKLSQACKYSILAELYYWVNYFKQN